MKTKKKPETIVADQFVILDCKKCEGSGEERYTTSTDEFCRSYHSQRTCTKCGGIGKLKHKLSNIKDA